MEGRVLQKKGFWTAEEDRILVDYVRVHGKGRWNRIAKMAGLKRGGKSCRLRWMNYLCPSVKRGNFTEEEDDLIIRLHNLLGNRWSLIAGRVPGRTDNQVKNHWNSHLSKKLGMIKRNKENVGAPSSLHFSEDSEGRSGESFKVAKDPTARITSSSGSQVKEGPQKDAVMGDLEPYEPVTDDYCISPSWVNVFYDNGVDVNIPSLMELLDGYSLNVALHDFS